MSNPLFLDDVPCVLDDEEFIKGRRKTASIPEYDAPEAFKADASNNCLIVTRKGYVIEKEAETASNTKPKLIDTERYTAYYKFYFLNRAHSNYVGEHSKFGPIICSVEHPIAEDKERVELKVLVKTKFEDAWIFIPISTYPKNIPKGLRNSIEKSQLEHASEFAGVKFSEIKHTDFPKAIAVFEQKMVPTAYKWGVLYCKQGQTTEQEMFNNVEPSKEFQEFLNFLGETIPLQNYTGYRGGLDVKTNTTGTHSVIAKHEGISIMFHVSTMIPFTPGDPQQVERKRHLGNDVVVIIFKDSDREQFDPSIMLSDFNHVFVIVTPDRSENKQGTWYRVGIVSKETVKTCEPPLPVRASFEKSEIFRHYLFTKIINCERSAMHAQNFKKRLVSVKEQQMKLTIAGFKKK